MRTYGGRILRNYVGRQMNNRVELRDGIVMAIDSENRYCSIKIQGSDKLIRAFYNENWGSQPEWLKIGNSVRVSSPGGTNRGRIEVVGHGILIPTAIPGGSVTPTPETIKDRIITGMALMASGVDMTAWVTPGTYMIDEETYTFSGLEMDNSSVAMDRSDLYIDEVGGSVSFAAAHSTQFRMDIVVIGTDQTLHVVQGDYASGEPTTPATPADHLLVGTVLIHPDMTAIEQHDINTQYTNPLEAALKITLSDSDLAWGQHTMTITLKVVDQYDQTITGDYHATVKLCPMLTGSLSATTGAAYTWLPSDYTAFRNAADVTGWTIDFNTTCTLTYTRSDDPAVTLLYPESGGTIMVEESTTSTTNTTDLTLRDALGNELFYLGTDGPS